MDKGQQSRLDDVFKKWDKNANVQFKKDQLINGKNDWTTKFGKNPAPIPRLARKFRTPSQRQRVLHEGYKGFIPNLGINISNDRITITNKCCCRCTPQSHMAWQAKSDGPLNLVQTRAYRRFGFLKYNFNDICICSHLKVSPLPDTKSTVLNSEPVQTAIATMIDETQNATDETKTTAIKTACKLYEQMCAHSWSFVARIAGYVLMKIFQFSTSGIIVQKKEVEILKQAVARKVPILYLPLHRSHLDYMILMFVLCLTDVPSPFVAAGDNLDIAIIGPLLRKLGAFYIRRRPKENHELYKAIMGQYLIELLKSGSSVEFFLEGRRSRSGLINPTKIGLLSKIVAAVKDGVIADVLLCPLSLTYDKVPEESLTLELKGVKKTPEKLLSALWYSVTFPFKQHYGSIHVNISEPFSLSEYIEKQASEVRLPTDRWISTADMDMDAVVRLATTLGDHVLYNAMCTSGISRTCLLSVLLLNVNSCTTLKSLEKTGMIWRDVIAGLKKEASFKFASNYLSEAIEMFGEHLDTSKDVNTGETHVSRIQHSQIDLLFHYYSAPLIVFSLPITSLCLSLPKITKTGINGVSTVSKQLLMQRAQYLIGLLGNALKFHPPCITVDQELSFQLDVLYPLEILKPKQSSLSTVDQKRLDKQVALWDDNVTTGVDEPYDDTLIVNIENLNTCMQISSVLMPYVQTLWFVLNNLDYLPFSKADFIKELCLLGEDEYDQKLRPALCTSITHIAFFVDKLVELSVINCGEEDLLYINPEYDNTEKMLQMVSYISTYFT